MAGKSTLNRLEHRPRREAGKYHKRCAGLEALFVDIFLDGHKRAPKEIVLDLDATDDTIHGELDGVRRSVLPWLLRLLPLYIFCGRFLLGAKLRPANIDGAAGAVDEVARCRPHPPAGRRSDRAAAKLMAWCEAEFHPVRRDDRSQAIVADQGMPAPCYAGNEMLRWRSGTSG